jgi:hypothetical protein
MTIKGIAILNINQQDDSDRTMKMIALSKPKMIAILKFNQQDNSDRTFKSQSDRNFKV